MDLAIIERCLTQILNPDIELDLDLCLISRAIDLDAINHVGIGLAYGNSKRQQGDDQQQDRANKIPFDSHKISDFQSPLHNFY